jgi:hypothetical protein
VSASVYILPPKLIFFKNNGLIVFVFDKKEKESNLDGLWRNHPVYHLQEEDHRFGFGFIGRVFSHLLFY